LSARGNVERKDERDFSAPINVRSLWLPNNGPPINGRSLIAPQQSAD
jgi:hypothetical protein